MKKKLNNHGGFLIILLVGLVLRIFFASSQGFMNDELSAFFRVDYTTFSGLINQGVKLGDMHPAFYQVLLYYWVRWFGYGDFVMRIPAILFYIGSSLLIYKIGLKFFTKWAGVVAVLFLSTLVFSIIDTTLTRPYVSALFFSLVFYYGLFKLFSSKRREYKAYFLIILGSIGAMYSHYFAFFTISVVGFIALFFIHKKQIIPLVLCAIISVLLFIPHWPITAYQLSQGGLQWLGYPDREWFFRFIYLFLNNSEIILIITFILPLVAYFSNKYVSEERKYVSFGVISFLAVLILGYIVSYAYTPILREKGLLFSLPLALLAYGNLYNRFKERHRFFILTILFVGFTIHTIWIGKLYKPTHYGALKEIAQHTETYNTNYNQDSILYLGNFVNEKYFNYYYSESKADTLKFETKALWGDGNFEKKLSDVENILSKSNKPYVALLYSNMVYHPQIQELIRLYYPTIKENHLYFNSGTLLFLKEKSNRTYLDSLSKETHPEQFSKWKESTSTDTYLGELKLKVSELKELKSSKNSYFLIKGRGDKAYDSEYRVTVTAERENAPIKSFNNELEFYQHYDMNALKTENGEITYFLAFEISDNLKNDDIVKIFIQNNDNNAISAEKPIVYAVDYTK